MENKNGMQNNKKNNMIDKGVETNSFLMKNDYLNMMNYLNFQYYKFDLNLID